MTEHATPHDFTPADAAAALAEARAYEEPLRQRTEGLTWILWAFPTAAIFVTYHAAAATFTGTWPWWTILLWAPWVLAGLAATHALWSTAALALPALGSEDARGGVLTAVWVAAFAAAWVGVRMLPEHFTGPVVWALAVGSAWTALAALNPYHASPRGRRVGLTIGGGFLALGVLLVATGAPVERASVLAIVGSGVIPLVGGLLQVHRG